MGEKSLVKNGEDSNARSWLIEEPEKTFVTSIANALEDLLSCTQLPRSALANSICTHSPLLVGTAPVRPSVAFAVQSDSETAPIVSMANHRILQAACAIQVHLRIRTRRRGSSRSCGPRDKFPRGNARSNLFREGVVALEVLTEFVDFPLVKEYHLQNVSVSDLRLG